ncbi:hypothetical protein BU24DRAFT_360822 [Aaosphaeria arxii CBS 175.79]|uniref:60S ribosomal protein L20 n=1 Tax=Aaosphaeria arxii CBS 175.79 TaxID=1450172 RepID=A0A6A5Y6L2_9PLEO|nr:uncharacterized protein BU24DRAFT_360822 [Aaosphaeria arxii CBS 175.79]KAF2020381.1 hypothetical protein BU24DRAFT_360822 [Aaosphaeria arxii CBS 175.79]
MSTCKPLFRTLPRQCQRINNLPLTQTRHESTTRRHKKLLHLPESPSYTSTTSEPTLIFNPPSASPNVYHTPSKFLPKDDSRKKLYAAAVKYSTQFAHRTSTPTTSTPGTPLQTTAFLPPKPSSNLPPPIRTPYEKKYHLTDADIAEIRSLRAQDPVYWTRVRLAEKFKCSQFFVGMVAKNHEKSERVAEEHQRARERWGTRRRMAKEDRGRRKELWGQDA